MSLATQRETARRMQETDQLLERQAQEPDRRAQETDRRLRGLHELFIGQWGKLMEALVEGDLVRLLQQRDIAVHYTVTNPRQDYGERRWEFDIVAVNGEEVGWWRSRPPSGCPTSIVRPPEHGTRSPVARFRG